MENRPRQAAGWLRLHGRTWSERGALVILVLLNVWFVDWYGRREVDSRKRHFITLVRDVARTLPIEEMAQLEAAPGDTARPGYWRVKRQLQAQLVTAPEVRFFYLLRRQGPDIVFLLDSERHGSPDESPPGQVFSEVRESFAHVFKDLQPSMEGPYRDRWGDWISACEPIRHPQDGRLLAVLCADLDAARFAREVRWERWKAGLFSLLAWCGMGFAFRMRRRFDASLEASGGKDGKIWILIPVLVLGIGESMTLFATREMRRLENDSYLLAVRHQGTEVVTSLIDVLRWHPSRLREEPEAFRFRSFLGTYLRSLAQDRMGIRIEDVTDSGSPRMLASYEPRPGSIDWGRQIRHLQLIRQGDGTWLVQVAPGDAFRKDNMGHADLWVLLLGSVLSALFAYVATVTLWERVRAESLVRERTRELFELHERLKYAQDVTGDGIWDWDLTTGNVQINHSMIRLLGFTDDQTTITERQMMDALHPQDRAGMLDAIQDALAGAATYRSIHRIVRTDGEIAWVEDRGEVVAWDAAGAPLRMVGNISDITQRVQAEEKVRKAQERLGNLYESMSQGVIVYGGDGKIQSANSAAERLLGLGLAQLQGLEPLPERWITVRGDGSDFTREEQPALLAITRKQPVLETILGTFHPDEGVMRWAMIDAHPKFDEHGEVVEVYAVITDITQLRRVELDLKISAIGMEEASVEAQEKALEASRASLAKSHFLANMSHEIRTPMNGVVGMTELLMGTPMNEEQQRYAKSIRSSGEALLSIINDILDFSKIEAGKMVLDRVVFQPRELLEDISFLLQTRAESKGLDLHCVVAPDVPTYLAGDPGRLRQILLNLGGNALKFTHAGEIRIAVECVGTRDGRATLRFVVSDTGIGIAPSVQATIFESFTQADASTSRRFGGTGLGLSISRQLVELMGGSMELESREGDGSTFRFSGEFDVVPDPASDERSSFPDKEAQSPDPRELRILLAEDNLTNQKVAVGMLSRLGLKVDVALDGQEAVLALESNRYDLVLMDCQMPAMNGYEATQMIRDPASAVLDHAVLIVALTANAFQEDRELCLQAGMDDFLTKPLSMKVLKAMLRKWLPNFRED